MFLASAFHHDQRQEPLRAKVHDRFVEPRRIEHIPANRRAIAVVAQAAAVHPRQVDRIRRQMRPCIGRYIHEPAHAEPIVEHAFHLGLAQAGQCHGADQRQRRNDADRPGDSSCEIDGRRRQQNQERGIGGQQEAQVLPIVEREVERIAGRDRARNEHQT